MNDFNAILEVINLASCVIILMFCLWAVLDKRVRTHMFGTLALACVAFFAVLNIAKPGSFGLLPIHYQVMMNVSLAAAGAWFFLHWRTKNAASRRRRKSDFPSWDRP